MNDIEKSSAKIQNNIGVISSEKIIQNSTGHTTSGITYKNVAKGTDLEYVINSTSLKENIIVDSFANVQETYRFTVNKGNLSVFKDDNENILFNDNNGDAIFTIPAPVMTDKNMAFSYDIKTDIFNENNSTVTIEYTPSQRWLSSSDR